MLLSESFRATRTLTSLNDSYRIPVLGVGLFFRSRVDSAFCRRRYRQPTLARSDAKGNDKLEHRLGVARPRLLRFCLLAIRTRPRKVIPHWISHRDVAFGR